MRGTFHPLPADRYSPGLRQMLSTMLALEPADRPTVAQVIDGDLFRKAAYSHRTSNIILLLLLSLLLLLLLLLRLYDTLQCAMRHCFSL